MNSALAPSHVVVSRKQLGCVRSVNTDFARTALVARLSDDLKIIACHSVHDDLSWGESYYEASVAK